MSFEDAAFRTDNGQLVLWCDPLEVVHACIKYTHALSSLCERVADNAGYTGGDKDVTCAICKERIAWHDTAPSRRA